jgi:type I restriction enzyme S subunit
VPPNFSLLKKESKKYLLLSEIADIKRGCFELKREEFVSSGAAKVYQPNHAISGDFSSGDRHISEEKYQQLKKYELQVDDIIMSVSGTWGKVSIFPASAERGIAWSMGLAIIRIKEEQRKKILPHYLLAILQAPNLEKFFLDSILSEDVMENLRVDHLKNLPIPIVSLAEQEKVIEELNNIQKMIENSEENMKTLKNRLSLSLSLL